MHTLELVFTWVLAASLRASLLAIVILALQSLLRARLAAPWRYGLWLPVLLVLLLPRLPESRWSVASLMNRKESRRAEAAAPASTLPLPVTALPRSPGGPPRGQGGCDARRCATLIWLGGAVLLSLFGGVSMARSLRRVRRRACNVEPPLRERIQTLAGALQMRQAPLIWLSHEVQGPAVCGVFRPVLLLNPAFLSKLSREESDLVLRHELTHIRRGDLLLHAIMCLLLALHWFNPVLWMVFFRVRLDREAACDADVLRDAKPDRRAAYGRALLKLETGFSTQDLCLGFVGMIQRGAALRSRLQLVVAQPSMSPLMQAALVLAMSLLTFAGIARAAEDTAAPQVRIEVKLVALADDAALDESARLALHLNKGSMPPAQGQALGALHGSEMQTLMRSLSATKGVDLMSAPTLLARSGQDAAIEVGQDFQYPLPNRSFASKRLGITLRAKATLQDSGEFAMEVSHRIVEVSGFEKDNGVDVPVFREHEAQHRAKTAPGATWVLEIPAETYQQTIIEPQTGQQDKVTDQLRLRRRFAFITTSLLPSGAYQPPPAGAGPDLLKRKLQTIIVPVVRFRDKPATEVLEFLRAQSVELDPSPGEKGKGVPFLVRAEQVEDAPELTLDLVNVTLEEALNHVTQLANLKYEVRSYAVLITGNLPAAKALPAPAVVKPRGGDLVLPEVKLEEARLPEAVALIRQLAIEVDPAKQGVIILPKDLPEQATFSLLLRNVPVDQALRYVAELCGCKLVCSPDAYTLTPGKGK